MIRIECDELNKVQTVIKLFNDYNLVNLEIKDHKETSLFKQKYNYILIFEDRL